MATSIYRPSFSPEEILELHSYITQLPRELIQEKLLYAKIQTKIATMAFKIDSGIARPAYIREDTPKIDMLDSLGGAVDSSLEAVSHRKAMYDEDSLDDWHAADPNIPD